MIVKMSVLPKIIYRFNANAIKTPVAFIVEIEVTILKFIWEPQKTSNSNLEKRIAKLKTSHFLISDYITRLRNEPMHMVN